MAHNEILNGALETFRKVAPALNNKKDVDSYKKSKASEKIAAEKSLSSGSDHQKVDEKLRHIIQKNTKAEGYKHQSR
ncbi:unnamed protein product [Caenorhabditis auriculariae]|uniref:Uncharacterized protein n=1 Tax=Caenorhabditis auriculariae TaxID=2777116 RepID=A0A8S1HW59_9PELO|nr:unnamed protein product [Caenorhabditis auriculariae]